MPRSIDKAAADFVLDQMGYAPRKRDEQRVEYRYRHAAEGYDFPIVLFFREGGIPEDDFRRMMVDKHGMPLAVVDAALEQL